MTDPLNTKTRKTRSGAPRGVGPRGRAAQVESARFVACPTCGEWLDRSDLAELVRHAETRHAAPTIQ